MVLLSLRTFKRKMLQTRYIMIYIIERAVGLKSEDTRVFI